jgi:hypothetical protein
MTLRKRINPLTRHCNFHATRPAVARILIRSFYKTDPITGEAIGPTSATIWTPNGWVTIRREDTENEAYFLSRIDALEQSQLIGK